MRNISKAQKQLFKKNWKAFHAANKHIKQPVVMCTDPYHTRRMGHLQERFYILYNYLTNKPLATGIAQTSSVFNKKMMRDKMWNTAMKISSVLSTEGTSYHNQYFVPMMKQYTDVFGEGLTPNILREFKIYIQENY